MRVLIEADSPRVSCPVHGPTVIAVPGPSHGVGHTRDFDEAVAWLATQCSKTAVVELMRVAWRTVGSIVARVSADIDAQVDRMAGMRRIGTDDIFSYKRGHRYLTVVVDRETVKDHHPEIMSPNRSFERDTERIRRGGIQA